MQKIAVLMGTRQKSGNTVTLVRSFLDKLSKQDYSIEYIFPQDYKIEPCIGCNNCFINTQCIKKDDIPIIQKKILEADLLVIASPVYLHYFTGELKMILDKCSWWAHTLRLQGKPVVIASTCSNNGNKTVMKALGEIMAFMGGNIIATVNAALMPNQIYNEKWLEEVSIEIVNRIKKYINLPPQSNKDIEKCFIGTKYSIQTQKELAQEPYNMELKEYQFWKESGMLEFNSFKEYLEEKYKKGEEEYESKVSATM